VSSILSHGRELVGRVASILSRWRELGPLLLSHRQGLVLLLLLGWMYASILTHLVLQWVGPHPDPNFTHGIFVPLFSLYVLWENRKKLRAIPSASSWVGLPLILLGLVMLVIGVLGAELFFQRASLLVMIAGLVILFRGWTFFRAILFPWAFLILMIPLPNLIMQQITFPLQLQASQLASSLLELVGVPVLLQGNLMTLPKIPLDVAEACSGIRSLLTLVTLAIIYGYLLETRIWVRVLLAFLAIPIAVIANSFRIFGTGLLAQYWDPDKAEGFYHEFEGWLIFVVAMILLFAFHQLILRIWKPGPVRTPEVAPLKQQPASNVSAKELLVRFGITATLMLATAVGLQAHSHSEVFPPREPLSSLPAQIDGWTSTDIPLDKETLKILGPGEYLMRNYENASNHQPWIDLFIAYFPSQRSGDTIHSPNHCLPGQGWVPLSKEVVQITRPDGSTFPANRYVGTKDGDRELALYWFQAHGRVQASQLESKYRLVSDSIHMNRSDGGLIRLMTPMEDGESVDAAQARMMKLGSQFLPLLDNYIPR
jgi:exosortase D (VPLPA-CTERM-specific)